MAQPVQQPTTPGDVPDLTGTTVGRFAIRARLGAGGMGEVYQAEDTRLKRPVALKRIAPQLKADQNYRQRFLREAQYASGLTNQNVAGVYDVLEENGEIFLVMEYVEGRTLRQRLSEPLGIEELIRIALQCAGALAAAHERSIVHHDIKPENIMLTPAGEVKILDFGVAKRLLRADDPTTLDTTTSIKSFSGTLAYMAPEVLLQKEPDQRADIFSLGVVLYEALSGRQPFLADSFLATSDKVLHEIPAPLRRFNSKVPAELERIVAKMLAKDPAERYATAADLLVDLRAAQRAMTHPRALAEPRAFASHSRWILWTAAAIVLIAATGLLFPKLRERWLHTSEATVLGAVKNLAVLPLQAVGGNPENQVFCDGITETVTASLVRLTATHALQVMPASEVRARHITSVDMARKELGVNLALVGSMDRFGSMVRVNYALVDTRTLRQVRAGTITAEASDPFAVQDRVAAGIVSMLELELKPQERQALQAHGTQVAGAYEFYLQGRGYLQNYDKPENVENAIALFQRALGLDPNYVLAHAGLGEAYWKRYLGLKDSQWIEPARRSCERALALDGKLAAAHICLGTIEDGTGRPEKAAEEFRRALETEPTSDDAYRGLGFAYDHLGRLAEAEQIYRQAIQLRPNYWAGYNWLGAFYYRYARYKEAEESFKQVVALVPDSFLGYSNLGAIYVRLGRYADAIQVLERSVAIRSSSRALSNLATAYFYQRRFDEAASRYEDALKLDDRNYIGWGDLGDAYYWALGKRAQATAAYQKAATLARERLQVNARDAEVLANLASYMAMLGERKPALASLQRALEISPDSPDVRFQAALVYNQFGEAQRALDWLQKAVAAGYSPSTIQNTPNFDALRSNPGFQALFQGK